MVTPNDQFKSPAAVPPKAICYRRTTARSAEAIYDAELVRRFNAGDDSAFNTIVTRYRELLFSVAFSVLKNRGDAEEIAQDAFLSAHRCLGGFRGDSTLATWLHRIALNLSRNRYWYFHRRCRHATVSIDSELREHSQLTFSDLVSTDAVCPARDVLIGEFSDIIATSMTRLGTMQREILEMQVTQRYSYAEIAQQFGVSVGTVKSRIARARDRLRVLISEACPEFNAAERRVEWFDPVRHTGGIKVLSA